MSWSSVTPWPRSRNGSTSTWYCLVSPPKLDDVDDAGHLLELALEDPVLGRLQLLERVALADDAVAEDLADRVPRRELRLHAGRQLHELEAVDDLLARLFVGRSPS